MFAKTNRGINRWIHDKHHHIYLPMFGRRVPLGSKKHGSIIEIELEARHLAKLILCFSSERYLTCMTWNMIFIILALNMCDLVGILLEMISSCGN